jgi:hypothetical protein
MIESHLYDKSSWPRGEWDSEPDRISWVDESSSYHCIMRRVKSSGHWCGYVAIPEGHPTYKQHYDYPNVVVHGGLTYADECKGDYLSGVCHLENSDEPPIWWFGFDCHHADDLSPVGGSLGLIRKTLFGKERTYRNVEYVKNEVISLAKQLKDLVNFDN